MPGKTKTVAAFQGEPGAFSHLAAQKLLGTQVALLPRPTFREVFEAVREGHATHAVVPIENTLHGSIHENYDNLLEYNLPIYGETSVRIAHCLIAAPGVGFRSVRRVFSHPVALNQCRNFFQRNPKLTAESFYDTAGSVKMLLEERPERAAAIASESAAINYGGVVLRRNLEDDRQNYTRFFLLAKQPSPSPRAAESWKTSLVFSMPNEPGALFKAMACFALRELSLCKVESRPLKGKPWEYLFYLDLLGRSDDPAVNSALRNLEEIARFVKVLGSYSPTP